MVIVFIDLGLAGTLDYQKPETRPIWADTHDEVVGNDGRIISTTDRQFGGGDRHSSTILRHEST